MRVEVPPDFAAAAGEKIDPILEILALSEDTGSCLRVFRTEKCAYLKELRRREGDFTGSRVEVRLVEARVRMPERLAVRDGGDPPARGQAGCRCRATSVSFSVPELRRNRGM
jgi:hypothetical protein